MPKTTQKPAADRKKPGRKAVELKRPVARKKKKPRFTKKRMNAEAFLLYCKRGMGPMAATGMDEDICLSLLRNQWLRLSDGEKKVFFDMVERNDAEHDALLEKFAAP